MLLRLSTLVVILIISGCQKEYHKPKGSDVDIVQNLNTGDYQKVISSLESKPNLSPRESYYLASALSEAGGVDVFSLYSVMEIELFHESALKWSDLSKDKNPYLKFMKSQDGVNDVTRNKKREANWNKYDKKIRTKYDFLSDNPPTLKELNEEYFSHPYYSEKDYQLMIQIFDAKEKELLAQPDGEEKDLYIEFQEAFFNKTKETSAKFAYQVANFYGRKVQYEILKRNYLEPESKASLFGTGSQRWEMIYMNILWNTYAAIPVMKKLPTFTAVQQTKITEALNAYFKLLNDKEFKDVAIKNIVILASVSMLGIYKGSFDFEEVKDVQDLMCSFDPEVILENYGLVRERIIFLSKVVKEAKSKIKDFEKYEANLDSIEKLIPETLDDENKVRYRAEIDKFKVDTCFSG